MLKNLATPKQGRSFSDMHKQHKKAIKSNVHATAKTN